MKANKLIPLLRRGDGSTLSLDFTAMGGTLDSRFTFTRASTATYINSAGVVTTMAAASTNDPTKARFDYDPTTLAPRGLLIEGSATNLCVQSAAVRSGPAWSTVGLTTQGPSIPAPDGTNSGVEIVATNGIGGSSAYSIQSVIATALATCTFSVFLKPKGVAVDTNLILQARDGASVFLSNFVVGFNHSTYQVSIVSPGTWTATSSNVVPFGNGWYRVSMTGTTPATTASFLMSIRNAQTGNGTDGVYAWGAQVETGSGASSYIPTGASTVQRAADQCEMTGSNFSSWFQSGTPYTMLFKYSMNSPAEWAGSNVDRGVGLLSASFNNPRVFINAAYRVASGSTDIGRFVRVYDSGTLDMAPSVYPAAASNTALVFAINTNDAAVSAANQSLGTDASCTLLTGYTDFSIGRMSGSSGHLNGCIRQIKYWPTRLPNATLQGLTQ